MTLRSTRNQRATLACLVTSVALAAAAAPAYAGTSHFLVNDPIGASHEATANNAFYINGVYCHELDYGQTRNIGIGAKTSSGGDYGTYVIYQTDGLRSYAGSNNLRGSCYNPHSVAYFANAHVNY